MSTATTRPRRPRRAAFARFRTIPTRWGDNDQYGHVNNVQYYAFFDTAVNQTLIEEGVLDTAASIVIGLVVETSCTFFESISFPEPVEIGLAAERIGASSLTYRIGVFRREGTEAAALGRFTHVYVDRATQRPVPLPAAIRAYAQTLVVEDPDRLNSRI